MSETFDLDGVRLSDLFDQAPGFMAILTGPDHLVARANAGFVRLTGTRDFQGRSFSEVLGPGVHAYAGHLDQVVRTGTPYTAHGAPFTPPSRGGGRGRHSICRCRLPAAEV